MSNLPKNVMDETKYKHALLLHKGLVKRALFQKSLWYGTNSITSPKNIFYSH